MDDVGAPGPHRSLLARPTFAGSVGAVIFLWASFSPTLMPRTWLTQAAISGLSAAVGCAIFTLAGWSVDLVVRRRGATLGERGRRTAWLIVATAAAVGLVGGLWSWARWQNDQRRLLGMDPLGGGSGVPMLVAAAAVFVVLVVLGRLLGRAVVATHRLISRRLSSQLAWVATAAVVVVVASFVLTDVIAATFRSWANSAFSLVDDETPDGVTQPPGPTVSGSPSSLAPWESLGAEGRRFVAAATPLEVIEEFQRSIGGTTPALDPIRVYVGIDTAADLQERADLAVAELERTGAFEREVLVVVSVTGTGWVDPDAAEALEILHGGDTAMVAMQYSFLPSWIATLLADGASAQAGAVLFDTVAAAWSQLPADDRPRLLIYGLSLGSQGAEAAFAGATAASSVANLTARADGALLAGPTNDNVVWNQITDDRDTGTPAWRPEFRDGTTVRFANTADELVDLDASWIAPRLLYVQHPSDPVTFWGMSDFVRPPLWMDDPRGPDLPDGGPWFPFVTGLQGVFDLMAGFGAPPGHGHDYRLAWPGAWAQVVTPDGWSASDTTALSSYLADRRAAAVVSD
jgi:uncharacterized membrane protein